MALCLTIYEYLTTSAANLITLAYSTAASDKDVEWKAARHSRGQFRPPSRSKKLPGLA